MSNRTERIARLATTESGNHFIDVYASYCKGGINYSTYRNKPRGYMVHVQPLKVEQTATGFQATSFMAFTGVGTHVKAANRFSQKQLEAVAAEHNLDHPLIKNMIEHVCEKQGIKLKEEAPATVA